MGSINCCARYGNFGENSRVVDSGIGIAKEHVDKIWNRFFQVEHGTKHYDGTGLGLDIWYP